MLILVFVAFLSISHTCTLKIMETSRNPFFDWRLIIRKTFFDKNCLCMNTEVSTEIITSAFKSDHSVYLNMYKQTKYCSGYIFVRKHLTDLKYDLVKTRRWGEDRFLCIIEDTQYFDLLQFIKDDVNIFKDSEAILIIKSNNSVAYHLSRFSRHLAAVPLDASNLSQWFVKDSLNFNGQQMSVSTFNCSVFSEFGDVDQYGIPGLELNEIIYYANRSWVGGVEMQLFINIAQRLNLKWKINAMDSEEMWGQLLENGTWSDGILKRVADGTSDIAFCTIWLSADKDNCLEMSTPWGLITQRLLIPRPTTLKTHWYAIFNPFHYELWLLMVLTTFISAVVLFTLVKMYSKFQELPESKTHNNSILSELFVMMGILFLGNFPNTKSYLGPARPFVSLWTIHSLLMMTAYSSSLVAHLTSPLFVKQISSLQELVENGYIWSSPHKIHDKILFNGDEWSMKFLEQYILETSEDLRESLIETGKYVFHAKSFDEKFATVDILVPSEILNSYEASQFYLKQFFVSFAFRKGTYFAEPFNIYILRFHSNGVLGKILEDLFCMEALKHPYVVNAFKKHANFVQGPTKLQVVNLKGAFIVLVIGLILSTVVFLFEFIFLFKI